MTSESIYRILLKAYPSKYRRKYEQAMAQCFRDQLRAADTIGKCVRVWLRILADFALSIPASYLECVLPRHGAFVYTEGARSAWFYARCEAILFGHSEVSLEDFLLGALRSDTKLASDLLGPDGVEGMVRAIEAHDKNPREGNESLPPPAVILYAGRKRFPFRRRGKPPIPVSQECKIALDRALEITRDSGTKIAPAHFLKAILHQETSSAARLLRERCDLTRLDAQE